MDATEHQHPVDKPEAPGERCLDSPVTGLHEWQEKNQRTFGAALPDPWLVCKWCQAWRDISSTPAPQRTVDNF